MVSNQSFDNLSLLYYVLYHLFAFIFVISLIIAVPLFFHIRRRLRSSLIWSESSPSHKNRVERFVDRLSSDVINQIVEDDTKTLNAKDRLQQFNDNIRSKPRVLGIAAEDIPAGSKVVLREGKCFIFHPEATITETE